MEPGPGLNPARQQKRSQCQEVTSPVVLAVNRVTHDIRVTHSLDMVRISRNIKGLDHNKADSQGAGARAPAAVLSGTGITPVIGLSANATAPISQSAPERPPPERRATCTRAGLLILSREEIRMSPFSALRMSLAVTDQNPGRAERFRSAPEIRCRLARQWRVHHRPRCRDI